MRRSLLLLAVMASTGIVPSAALAQVGPPLPDVAPAQAPVLIPRDTIPGVDLSTINPSDLDGATPLLQTPDLSNPLRVLENAGAALPRSQRDGEERAPLSTAVSILLVLTLVSLAPSIMLMTTSFLRVLVVLGLLRQALGVQSVPPPQVVTALALFLTLLVMAPTMQRIHAEAIVPYREGDVTNLDELWDRGKQPVRDFMFAQLDATGNWSSLYMILEYRGVDVSEPALLTRADVDMISLIPAYMLSELKVAFLMGFKLYLPFLVIDMVISTMLIAMSMMMLPPVLISLPFKLLLFVLVDGWTLVVGGLLTSFQQPGAVAAETALALPAMYDLAAHALSPGPVHVLADTLRTALAARA